MATAKEDKVDPLEASEANYAKLEGQFQEVRVCVEIRRLGMSGCCLAAQEWVGVAAGGMHRSSPGTPRNEYHLSPCSNADISYLAF
jgi:hypothetical protein